MLNPQAAQTRVLKGCMIFPHSARLSNHHPHLTHFDTTGQGRPSPNLEALAEKRCYRQTDARPLREAAGAGPALQASDRASCFLSRVGTLPTTTTIHLPYESGGSLCLTHHKEDGTISFLILELLRKFVLQILHCYYLMLTFQGLGNVKITHASTLARAKGKAKFVGAFFHAKVMIIIY